MEETCNLNQQNFKENKDPPRVLLIAPTAMDYNGRPIKENRLHLPALTLPLLAALTPDNVEVRLIYETVESIPFHEHWDLVGLTGMGSGIVRAWQIADKFRELGTRVVIGGIAASNGNAEWTLEHADAMIIGEAESLWPQVVQDFLDGTMRKEYQSENPVSLEDLPVPRYDLMNQQKIGLWRPVQATRGCPHPCTFCSVTAFFKGTFRKRPIDQVIRDVRAAVKAGSRYIAFIDDNISADIEYCAKLWEALIPEKIIWMSQCTISLADNPSFLKLAYRSGCRLVSVGIESTNETSLKSVGKGFNRPASYSEAISSFRKHGIEVSTEMIIGFDDDDPNVFEDTYKFIMTNRISIPRVHILTPVPGTPLFKELLADGRLTNQDFSNYTGSKINYRPKKIGHDAIQKEYWKLYERLFTWRAILSRLIPSCTRAGLYMRLVIWVANIRYRGHIRARISPGIL